MKKSILVVMMLMIFSMAASAFVFGGTNLDFFGYPDCDCTKPLRPYKPISFDAQWQIDDYNLQVSIYNLDMEPYTNCVNEYVDNARNDIKLIVEKANQAIKEANR